MTTNPRQRARLRLADAAEIPDTRAAVARALLDRYFPVDNVIADNMLHNLRGDFAAYAEMESDPRYLIGRLQQALTALLQRETPPLDATMTLLAEAIADAIDYRSHDCPKCPGEEPCAVIDGRVAVEVDAGDLLDRDRLRRVDGRGIVADNQVRYATVGQWPSARSPAFRRNLYRSRAQLILTRSASEGRNSFPR